MDISRKEKYLYLNRLIGKIYKTLPLFEVENMLPSNYLNDLIFEIHSANDIFNGILIEIIVKLNSLNKPNISHGKLRKIILECTNMIVKMLDEMKGDRE